MYKKQLDRTVLTVAVIGSLVLLNILGLALFGRLDLTRDRQFTLSDATLAALRDLHEPLTVRAYFTKDLPPPHSTNARYVRDLLDEYYAHSRGHFRFEFIDPVAEESSSDKEKKKDVKQDIFGRQIREATAMERELSQLGIPPVQVRVNEADKLEVKRAYMGLALQFGDRKEAIPVVSETTGLEYNLTTLMRKMVRAKTPKVGVLSNHEGLSPQSDFGKAYGLLTELFEVSQVDLSHGPPPADLDALLVVGPKTPFTDAEKHLLDAYLTSGGHGLGLLLGPIKPNLQNLDSTENKPELDDLLRSYGVVVEPGLVADAECATLNVAQQAGFMRINHPVSYPFIAIPRSLEMHPLTRGLAQVVFPFMAPVRLNLPADSAVKGEVLASSSKDSLIIKPPFNLDPLQRWAPPSEGMQAQPLIVALSGPIKSAYAATSATAEAGGDARLLVAGGASFVSEQFFGKTNETLLLNLVDWLVRDDGLLAVRSRGLSSAPLQDVSDGMRNSLKYLNILGLPTAFVAFGLVRWRRREARRDKVTL